MANLRGFTSVEMIYVHPTVSQWWHAIHFEWNSVGELFKTPSLLGQCVTTDNLW